MGIRLGTTLGISLWKSLEQVVVGVFVSREKKIKRKVFEKLARFIRLLSTRSRQIISLRIMI